MFASGSLEGRPKAFIKTLRMAKMSLENKTSLMFFFFQLKCAWHETSTGLVCSYIFVDNNL